MRSFRRLAPALLPAAALCLLCACAAKNTLTGTSFPRAKATRVGAHIANAAIFDCKNGNYLDSRIDNVFTGASAGSSIPVQVTNGKLFREYITYEKADAEKGAAVPHGVTFTFRTLEDGTIKSCDVREQPLE